MPSSLVNLVSGAVQGRSCSRLPKGVASSSGPHGILRKGSHYDRSTCSFRSVLRDVELVKLSRARSCCQGKEGWATSQGNQGRGWELGKQNILFLARGPGDVCRHVLSYQARCLLETLSMHSPCQLYSSPAALPIVRNHVRGGEQPSLHLHPQRASPGCPGLRAVLAVLADFLLRLARSTWRPPRARRGRGPSTGPPDPRGVPKP